MGSSIPLEKSVIEESSLDLEDDSVYLGNRFTASLKFAREVTSFNSSIFLDSLKDIKRLWLINPTPIIGPFIAAGACYILTPITSFTYSSFALRYSEDKNGYVFNRTTRDRLSIIG